MKRLAILAALIVLLAGPGRVLADRDTPSAVRVDWAVFSSGGGRVEEAALALKGTIGQAVIGTSSQATFDLCAGFLCGVDGRYSTHLPVLFKAQP